MKQKITSHINNSTPYDLSSVGKIFSKRSSNLQFTLKSSDPYSVNERKARINSTTKFDNSTRTHKFKNSLG